MRPPGTPDTVPGHEPNPRLVESTEAGAAAVRGSVLVSGAYVVTFLLSLISVPLLTRHLGLAAFGRYSTVVSLVTVIGGLSDSGMITIALREWSTRTGDDRQRTMRLLVGLRLELGTAGIVVGVLYAFVAGFDHALLIGTLLASIGMLMQISADLLAVGLQGDLRFGWSAIVSVSRQVVAVALIVILVIAGAGLVPFLAVTIPASFVTLMLIAFVVRGRMPLRPMLRGKGRWTLLRDTIPYSAAVAVNTVYFQVTILVMHQIASAQQTGYFSLSFRVIQVLIGVPGLAIGAAFPILTHSARADSERFRAAAGRILELSTIVAAPLVLALVLGAPFIVDVLAGHAGRPAVPVLQIQALTLIATFIATASGYVLISLRRNVALLIGNSAALAANVALSLLLVPSLRAQGAAISGAAAEGCLALGQLAFALRAGGLRLKFSTIAVVAVAAAVGVIPLLIPGLYSLIRVVIGLAAYTAVITAMGRFPNEITHLRRIRSER